MNWVEEFFALNPDALPILDEKKSKEHKLDLFKVVLPALDKQDIGFYDRLDSEQKKEIVPWLLMRWMSSSSSLTEHHLMMVNDIVNKDFSIFAPKVTHGKIGHPGLQWKLLALCGAGKNQRHVWIAPPRGVVKNKLESAVLTIFPLMKDEDLELFLQINTPQELKDLLIANGFDNKTLKDIFKE